MKAQSKNLSKREKEVVELLLQGKSNKQIALALGITESTVEFHLKNVYAKLQVGSRAEAILKLGKSIGLASENLGVSVVDEANKKIDISSKFILWKRWISLIKETVSTDQTGDRNEKPLIILFSCRTSFWVVVLVLF